MTIRVYTASCMKHSGYWREIAASVPDIEWVARWPTEHCGNIPDSETFAKWFWQQDFEDVSRADVVLVFAEQSDNLRGALVEAGIGIALHKRVMVVGKHHSYGTWQYHPAVVRVDNMDQAIETLRLYARFGIHHFN